MLVSKFGMMPALEQVMVSVACIGAHWGVALVARLSCAATQCQWRGVPLTVGDCRQIHMAGANKRIAVAKGAAF